MHSGTRNGASTVMCSQQILFVLCTVKSRTVQKGAPDIRVRPGHQWIHYILPTFPVMMGSKKYYNTYLQQQSHAE